MSMKKKGTPSKGLKLLIASGVNLDLLGQREPAIYGQATLADMETAVRAALPALAAWMGFEVRLEFFQTNDEVQFLNKLSEGWDGAVLNPGAWTHTSLALGDRLAALGLLFVETHLSNLARREEFRQRSFAAVHAGGIVQGFGIDSYVVALTGLLLRLKAK